MGTTPRRKRDESLMHEKYFTSLECLQKAHVSIRELGGENHLTLLERTAPRADISRGRR